MADCKLKFYQTMKAMYNLIKMTLIKYKKMKKFYKFLQNKEKMDKELFLQKR